jgi:hypothetical protein
MPECVPQLPPEQYALPLAIGRLYDCTILSSDALRPLADLWCQLAMENLLRAGSVVAPLRAVVDTRLVTDIEDDYDDDNDSDDALSIALTSSSVSSSDSEL